MKSVMPGSQVARYLTVSTASRSRATRGHGPVCSPNTDLGGSTPGGSGWRSGSQELAERWPEALLRGMIQSDGCRFINNRGRSDTWTTPRYAFGNVSTDVTSIFCTACDRLGLRWTAAFPSDERKAETIYVSRKADVARMDEFIGPKA